MFGTDFQGGKQAFQLYTCMLDSLIAFLGSDAEYLPISLLCFTVSQSLRMVHKYLSHSIKVSILEKVDSCGLKVFS